MASEWRILSLQEAKVALIDCDHRTPPPSTSGYPYVAIPQLRNGRINFSDARRITFENYKDWTRKALPIEHDVVLSRRCNPGETAFVSSDVEFALGQNLVLLRADGTEVYPPFLRWLVRGSEWSEQIGKFLNVGAVFDSLRCADVPKFQLPIPPQDEQRAIAHILGTLDDKIELNRRMNETLEAMARALFQSWFVDFDPVRAKAAVRREHPRWTDAEVCRAALPTLAPEIAALFPDSFENSALGDIPKGWHIGKFSDVAENSRRGISPGDIPELTPYIALEHMPRKCIALSEWGIADGVESGKFAFNANDILFGKLRPYFHKVGVAPIDGVCSTDILVLSPRAPEWFGFVLSHASSDAFVEHANAGSTGTKMPRTNWTDMARYPVILPPETLAKAYTAKTTPAISRIIASIHQNHSLVALRDTLLPKLISGELRVSGAAATQEKRSCHV